MSSADRRVREREKGSRWLRRATAALAAAAATLTGVFSALAVQASTAHGSRVVTPAVDTTAPTTASNTPSIATPAQVPTTTSAPAVVQSSGS